jgi:hypothetical protein
MKTRPILLLTALVALAYSVLVAHYQSAKLWDWLNTLVAAGISFFFAIVAGIHLYWRQSLDAKASKNAELQLLLGAELSDLYRVLKDGARTTLQLPSGNKINVLVTYVQPLVTEHAALSGLFDATQSENLVHFARKCRMFNTKVNYFLGLLQSRAPEEMLVHAHSNIEETRTAIVGNIQQMSGHLGLKLSDSHQAP